MDDFPGILARDFGFKPQGKSAPMAAPRSSSTSASGNFGVGSDHPHRSSSTSSSKPIFDDHDHLFNDVFGGPPKYSSQPSANSTPAFDYESIFKDQTASKSGSNAPVFDKPVYDEDIFEGLPGIKSSSTSGVPSGGAKFTNVASMNKPKSSSSPFDDLLGNLGNKDAGLKSDRPNESEKDSSDFRDLLAGFGGSGSSNRSTSESGRFQKSSSNSANAASSVMDDPFVVLESSSAPASGIFPDPLEEISKFSSSGNTRLENASVGSGVFDDIDPLQSLGKSAHPTSSDGNKMGKDRSPLKNGAKSAAKSSASQETVDKFRMDSNDSHSQKRMPVDNFQESHETIFDMPNVSTDFHRSVGRSASPPSYMNPTMHETNSQANSTPRAKEAFESPDDVWLTVSEIPLFTQPTSAPPPSRPPPPRPTRVSRSETGSFSSTSARKKVNEYSSFPNSTKYAESPKSAPTAARSSIDELEDFAMGRTHNSVNERAEVPSGDDFDSNSVAAASAAAMKEAMDRAEAKFRHAKEMREREYLKAARSKEAVQQDRDEYAQDQELRERQERLERERQQREREEEEREQRRLEKERERAREIEREREEKEREQRKLERERLERERELARLAVERATREARERAAAEARVKAERAAVEKAAAEARERAGRKKTKRGCYVVLLTCTLDLPSDPHFFFYKIQIPNSVSLSFCLKFNFSFFFFPLLFLLEEMANNDNTNNDNNNHEESSPLLSKQVREEEAENNYKSNENKKATNVAKPEKMLEEARSPARGAGYGWTADGLPLGHGSVMGEPMGRAQWDSSLFACLGRNDDFCSSDLEVCLLGSVAPCMLYGSNVERLGSTPGTFANHCLPYTGLYLIGNCFFGWNCLAPWFSYPSRSAIRRRFDLEGSCEALNRSCGCCGSCVEDDAQREQCESACDLATHIFCHPCALCQEGRELRRRLPHPGFNAQPVLVMIAPGEQTMGRGA